MIKMKSSILTSSNNEKPIRINEINRLLNKICLVLLPLKNCNIVISICDWCYERYRRLKNFVITIIVIIIEPITDIIIVLLLSSITSVGNSLTFEVRRREINPIVITINNLMID
jgi:hypothetical protein